MVILGHDGLPTGHNIPGFLAGIGGTEFLATLKDQSIKYGAEIHRAHVSHLIVNDGISAFRTETGPLYSRYVLSATGVRDHLPDIEGASEAVMRSILRFCPVCDAFEAIDKRIAVIGDETWASARHSF